MVVIPVVVTADHFQHVRHARNLLMAHRTPYVLFEWLVQHTQRLWQGLTALDVLSECTPHPPCHPGTCTHGTDTRACSLVIELPLSPGGPNVVCEAKEQTQQCICEARHGTEIVRRTAACSCSLSSMSDTFILGGMHRMTA